MYGKRPMLAPVGHFTGNLPDSPVNAVLVYQQQVFVATDVGVFASPTSIPSRTELGPSPSSGFPGYLPNVAVTALSIFHYGSQQLLRAATYGRGIWEFNLVITPDYKLVTPNFPLTIFASETGTIDGTATALNGYTSSITLSWSAGAKAPPSTCTLSPGWTRNGLDLRDMPGSCSRDGWCIFTPTHFCKCVDLWDRGLVLARCALFLWRSQHRSKRRGQWIGESCELSNHRDRYLAGDCA